MCCTLTLRFPTTLVMLLALLSIYGQDNGEVGMRYLENSELINKYFEAEILQHTGQEVDVILTEDCLPGSYSGSWDASMLPPGTYYIKMHGPTTLLSRMLIRIQ